MKKVLIIAPFGMLGSVVTSFLSKRGEFEIFTVGRRSLSELSPVELAFYDKYKFYYKWTSEVVDTIDYWPDEEEIDFCVNCAGATKPRIDGTSAATENAIRVNSLLPHVLVKKKWKTIQILTDCIFDGRRGGYNENDKCSVSDIYGTTKALGEVNAPNVYQIRSSIIGPELSTKKSFLEWILTQPSGATINSFLSHTWNGVPTVTFARLVYGIIKNDAELKPLQHWVPAAPVSKADLVNAVVRAYKRNDLSVIPKETEKMDRSLTTLDPKHNLKLWELAGYSTAPFISDLVEEMAAYKL